MGYHGPKAQSMCFFQLGSAFSKSELVVRPLTESKVQITMQTHFPPWKNYEQGYSNFALIFKMTIWHVSNEMVLDEWWCLKLSPKFFPSLLPRFMLNDKQFLVKYFKIYFVVLCGLLESKRQEIAKLLKSLTKIPR